MSSSQRASSHAARLLEPLGNRGAHVQAVAEQAGRIAPAVLSPTEREMLIAAAWLHDIGYAPELATTGFHPLDGARHLEALGVDRRLCCLVAHHSGATFEAEERGYTAELAARWRPASSAPLGWPPGSGPCGCSGQLSARCCASTRHPCDPRPAVGLRRRIYFRNTLLSVNRLDQAVGSTVAFPI